MALESHLNAPNDGETAATAKRHQIGRIFLWLAIGLVALVLLTLGWRISYYYKLIKKTGAISLTNHYGFTSAKQLTTEAAVTANLATKQAPSLGSPDAKITIVEFADFECPYSKEAFTTMREFVAKNKDKIRLVFRHFPLADIHPEAVAAAEAGSCANEQGKFWPMHDKLFQNQDRLQTADLKNYAGQIGLDSDKFAACLDGHKFRNQVLTDYQAGFKAGVAGTPTFFVNGERAEGAIPLFEWEKVLAY